MKLLLIFLLSILSVQAFCQVYHRDPGFYISETLTSGELSRDSVYKNDTALVVLKTIVMESGIPKFRLQQAIAIYSKFERHYWEYPQTSSMGPAGGYADCLGRFPIDRSRIDRTLLKILIDNKEFNLSKYYEMIPVEDIINH